MLGVAHLPDPTEARKAVRELREQLLADPYFRGVPSMQPESGRTARAFHAKNDPAEVRREVFRLLPSLGVKVQAVVRRKRELVSVARHLHSKGQRLTANDVYDDMVKRLFRNLLHKADENRICFAWRGKSDRSEALTQAIRRAQRNFERKWRISSDKPTLIRSMYPWEDEGLQVVDYFLWALQRLYERHEDRFFELLRPSFRLVMDLDDKRNHEYGEWYSDANPLDLRKMETF